MCVRRVHLGTGLDSGNSQFRPRFGSRSRRSVRTGIDPIESDSETPLSKCFGGFGGRGDSSPAGRARGKSNRRIESAFLGANVGISLSRRAFSPLPRTNSRSPLSKCSMCSTPSTVSILKSRRSAEISSDNSIPHLDAFHLHLLESEHFDRGVSVRVVPVTDTSIEVSPPERDSRPATRPKHFDRGV